MKKENKDSVSPKRVVVIEEKKTYTGKKKEGGATAVLEAREFIIEGKAPFAESLEPTGNITREFLFRKGAGSLKKGKKKEVKKK